MDFGICNHGSQCHPLQNLVPSPQLLKELAPVSSVSRSSLSPSSPLSPSTSFRSSATSFEDHLVSSDPLDQLDSFLRDALNSRNRMTVLRLEHEIEKFVTNPRQQQLLLNPMPSSYERLAAHRVAHHYHVLSIAIDSTSPSGARVLWVKTSDSRVPSLRLVDVPVDSKPASPSPGKLAIKQRSKDSSSSSGSYAPGRSTPVRSVEERMEDYNKARARIFGDGEITSTVCEPGLEVSEPVANVESTCIRAEVDEFDDDFEAKAANTVAVFRDREKDMKDPDYDRNRFLQPSQIMSLSPSVASGIGYSSSKQTWLGSQSGYGQQQKHTCFPTIDNHGCIWVGQTGLPVVGYPVIVQNSLCAGFYSYNPHGYNGNQELVYPRHYSSVDWRQAPIKVKPCSMS